MNSTSRAQAGDAAGRRALLGLVALGLGTIAALSAAWATPALATAASTPAWFDATGAGTRDRLGGWPDLSWAGTARSGPGAAKQGDAFLFDGTNGLRSPDPVLGDLPAGPFTVQFDVQTQQVPAAGASADILSKRAAGDHWEAQLKPDGEVAFTTDVGGVATTVTSTRAINDGRWHTVSIERLSSLCITIDGDPTSAGCTAMAGSAITAAGATFAVANGHPLIGPTLVPFVGRLDNLYLGPAPSTDLAATSRVFRAEAGADVRLWFEVSNPSADFVPATLDLDLPAGISLVGPAPTCWVVATGAACDNGPGGVPYPPGKVTVSLRLRVDRSVLPGTELRVLGSWLPVRTPDRSPANNTETTLGVVVDPARPQTVPATPPVVRSEPPAKAAPAPAPTPTPKEDSAPIAGSPPPVASPTTTAPRRPRSDEIAPSARRATLVAASQGGESSARAGVGLRLAGSGYESCEHVYFFFDRAGLGRATPDGDGNVTLATASIPGGAATGRHTVTSSCSASGEPIVQGTTFAVDASSWHRSALTTSLPHPSWIDWGPAAVAGSALLAAGLTFVLGFPSELFDRTLAENYDEIRRWFRLRDQPRTADQPARRRMIAAAFFATAALLSSLLDPSFGWSTASIVTFLGCLASLLAVLAFFNAAELVFMRRRFGARGILQVRPGTLVLAVAFVASSRFLHLQPGYLYGLLAGFAFHHEVPEDAEGRLSATSVVFMVAVGFGAWFTWSVLSGPASADAASPALLIVEAALGTLFLASFVTAAFAMLPMRILEGRVILLWSRRTWFALSLLAFFFLTHIVLRPHGGYASKSQSGSLVNAGLAFGAFAAFSVVFWAYFRFRPARPTEEHGPEPPEPPEPSKPSELMV